jgi:hypothetical protein
VDRTIKWSPLAFRDQIDNTVLSGEVIEQLRNQFIGEEKGLRHLASLLASREEELRKKLKQQEDTK